MQQAHSALQSQQQQLVAEIQEWKARYRDEAAYSSELQAAANRLQSELTAAQLESQVGSPPSCKAADLCQCGYVDQIRAIFGLCIGCIWV